MMLSDKMKLVLLREAPNWTPLQLIEAVERECQFAFNNQAPVAWLMLNSHGDEISISESNLRHKQDKHVQKLWIDATPLIPHPNARNTLSVPA
jgi:aromatic ring-cleaving dioxygenase